VGLGGITVSLVLGYSLHLFFNLSVLKDIVDFLTMLIGAEGAKTPAAVRGRGDPTGALAPRRLPEYPRKAKRLESKSTDKINTAFNLKGN
jgi:hypothetical protein